MKFYSISSLFVLFSVFSFIGNAATYYSRINGNWNTASTWSIVSCSGAASATIPTSADNVIICAGRTVTMNGIPGSCFSLTVNGTAKWISVAAITNVGIGGLVLNNGASLSGSVAGVLNVAGTCSVPVGSSISIGGITISILGTTYVSGTLVWNTTAGTKTFCDININTLGIWNNSVNEGITLTGNLLNNGVFIAGTGTYTLAGIGKTISGFNPITIRKVVCTGDYINSANLTTRRLSGIGGVFTQSSTGILNYSGNNISVTTFNASTVGNTVIFIRAGAQNIRVPSDGGYYNLSVTSSGLKTLLGSTILGNILSIAAGTTLNTNNFNFSVGGNFTNNGTFTSGTSTVTLNGTVAQTIGGTASTAFNNLTISNATAIVTGATNFSVSNTFNIGAGAIFSPNATVIVSGVGTLTGNGIARVTRIAATADFVSQYTITGKTLAGLNIDYIGAGNQSVNALNYGSLTVSTNGTRTVTFPAAVVGVSNIFSPSSVTTTYVITGNTITFNGTVAQSVPAFTYNNLISAGSNTKSLSGNVIVNNDLTITSNLDVSASNNSISIKRNWINNGVFNAQTGTVTFNGAVAQTLSGASTTTFNQLDINNTSGGVSITGGTYVLNSVISPINGNFNTNGNSFTMVSNASQTARIATMTASASLSGNFIIQRYITARDTSFADLSSTVQTSTLGDWGNELPAVSYIHTPPSALASAFTYDETADVYVPVTAASASLNPGKGFEVFLAGDFSYASLPNTTMNAIGVPNQGDQNLSSLISNNVQGWNLVGNPFASNISWASIYAASGGAASGLYDFIEMYDYTIGDWNGYTSADAIEIGSAQGFWVYGLPSATSLSLIIPESSKTTTSNSSIKALTVNQSYFTLKIASDLNNFSHSFKVNANADASDAFDALDLPFRASPNKATPSLYANIEGAKVNLNTFNSSNVTYSFPLTIKVNAAGIFKISASGFEFLNDYKCIQLEDKLKNTFINLSSQGVYEFEMFRLEDEKRFVLHFNKDKDCKQQASSEGIVYDLDNTVEVLPYDGGNVLNFNYSETTNTAISVHNLLGQDIIEKRNVSVSSQSETILLPEDFKGIYFVKISSDKGTIVKKFFKR